MESCCPAVISTSRPPSSGFGAGFQARFDTAAQMLVLGRYPELLVQVGDILVAVESWLAGRDLEQHAAGRAKVDGPEVVAIDHRSDLESGIEQCLPDRNLGGTILHGERDVMDRACTLPRH